MFYSYTASLIYLFLIKTKTILKYLPATLSDSILTNLSMSCSQQGKHSLTSCTTAEVCLCHTILIHFHSVSQGHKTQSQLTRGHAELPENLLTSLGNEPSANFYQCLLSYFTHHHSSCHTLSTAQTQRCN